MDWLAVPDKTRAWYKHGNQTQDLLAAELSTIIIYWAELTEIVFIRQ